MSQTAVEAPTGARDGNAVDVLVSVAASAATALVSLTAVGAWHAIAARPYAFAGFFGLTVGLQLITVSVYDRGTLSVSGIGLLAMGFTFGVGAAAATGIALGALHWARTRGRVHRAILNGAAWAVSAGAAAAFFHGLGASHWSQLERIVPALIAGAMLWFLNVGAMSLAMSLATGSWDIRAIWRERFAWVTPYYLMFGPLALASTIAYEQIGMAGLVAFAVPPALVVFSMHQYIDKTRASVEEVQRANEELKSTNDELATRNDDLHELFDFATGLAAQAHDRRALVSFADGALERLTGSPAHVTPGAARLGADTLESGGVVVGSVRIESTDNERWERLRDAIVPQLATAVESATLVEEMRKRHLATIAALSRSMEAKDGYTGGHTERVADVAVAVARRMGYAGEALEAIQIGALLHDIGKIGIPEHILHKPGPLDESEWAVMRTHPVVSEYILAGIDLHPIVLQIARSSHERIDGRGYPDALAGDSVPLPARIAFVADAFDALTSDRPYRPARPVEDALAEIRAHAGSQFCPDVVEALARVIAEERLELGLPEPLHVAAVAVA